MAKKANDTKTTPEVAKDNGAEVAKATAVTQNTATANNEAKEKSQLSAIDKKAETVMNQHGLSKIFMSKDGYFFTDEGSARNHDKEYKTFTKKSK